MHADTSVLMVADTMRTRTVVCSTTTSNLERRVSCCSHISMLCSTETNGCLIRYTILLRFDLSGLLPPHDRKYTARDAHQRVQPRTRRHAAAVRGWSHSRAACCLRGAPPAPPVSAAQSRVSGIMPNARPRTSV